MHSICKKRKTREEAKNTQIVPGFYLILKTICGSIEQVEVVNERISRVNKPVNQIENIR